MHWYIVLWNETDIIQAWWIMLISEVDIYIIIQHIHHEKPSGERRQ